MDLLTFFALPVATIILAFVLEKILRSPILTALSFFAIYLIITFAVFDSSFLIYTIVYTVLAYISALIAEYIYTNCTIGRITCRCGCNNSNNENTISTNTTTINNTSKLSDEDINKIACRVSNTLYSSFNNNVRRIR